MQAIDEAPLGSTGVAADQAGVAASTARTAVENAQKTLRLHFGEPLSAHLALMAADSFVNRRNDLLSDVGRRSPTALTQVAAINGYAPQFRNIHLVSRQSDATKSHLFGFMSREVIVALWESRFYAARYHAHEPVHRPPLLLSCWPQFGPPTHVLFETESFVASSADSVTFILIGYLGHENQWAALRYWVADCGSFSGRIPFDAVGPDVLPNSRIAGLDRSHVDRINHVLALGRQAGAIGTATARHRATAAAVRRRVRELFQYESVRLSAAKFAAGMDRYFLVRR